jgi:flagellar motor switch protein FliN/FliY
MTPIEEIATFLDVPLQMDVELDRPMLTVREIMAFDIGYVLKLTRSAGENLDVRLGGALIASGEIVISESTTGVRIADFRADGRP